MQLFRVFLTLFAFALAAPALAEDVTFAGLVTYRERMALPADASLTITLVSLPDQVRVTGAQATLGGKAGSPLQFSLNVRSNVLSAGGQYGLVAEIESGGYVIFTNTQPVVVDAAEPEGNVIEVTMTPPPPHEAPEQVLPPEETPNPLLDIVWTVVGLGGDPVLGGSNLTFSIASDSRAGGSGGCNNYFTEASFENPPLSFGPVAATRMACDAAIMEQEALFFAALAATVGYELGGNELALIDASGVPVATLIRAP